jgi:rhodanese-related sulfurtransferase
MKDQAVLRTIPPHDLPAAEKAYLVDVRTPMEFEEAHIAGAELHPLHGLNPSHIKEKAQGRPVHLICKTGNRARQAAEKLTAAGVEQVTVLDGGLEAWARAGLDLRRGKKGISLERQVRIGAGALVLAGAVGSVLVHPALVALSGFVGAGLIFAGITDWCGMGMLLARMPWNKQRATSCAVDH